MKRVLIMIPLLALAFSGACAPVAKPEAGATIIIVDALGREIAFKHPPERVVVVGRASQLILHAAYFFDEADERIVAMEQRTQRESSCIPLLDSAFEEKAQLERDVAAEGIAPIKPDALIMKSYLAESLGAPIEALGLTTVYLDLETPEQFFRDVRTLGNLFDNSERVEQVISFYQDRLARVSQAVAEVPEDRRPRVLFLQYSDRGGEVALNVPAPSWLQTNMVELAGGIPVWLEVIGSGWTVVNFEQIAAWDADQIYMVYYAGDPVPIVESLKQDPAWSALRAGQSGEIYAFAGDYLSWDQPDPRWILGLEWLADRILPDDAYDFDALAEVSSFYQELYGLDQATIDAQVKPLLNGDLAP